MNTTTNFIIENYLIYCKSQKRLDQKTLNAYRIVLTQFSAFVKNPAIPAITISDIESYIGHLNQRFRPKTTKKKLLH